MQSLGPLRFGGEFGWQRFQLTKDAASGLSEEPGDWISEYSTSYTHPSSSSSTTVVRLCCGARIIPPQALPPPKQWVLGNSAIQPTGRRSPAAAAGPSEGEPRILTRHVEENVDGGGGGPASRENHVLGRPTKNNNQPARSDELLSGEPHGFLSVTQKSPRKPRRRITSTGAVQVW